MGFNLSQFLGILNMVAPIVTMLVPGGAQLAPLIPIVVKGIGDAQQTHKSGADKKAAVLALVKDAVEGTNIVKAGTLDPALTAAAAAQAIDAIITTIHAIEAAHAKLPEAPALITGL